MKKSDLTKALFKYFDQDLNVDMEPEWIEDVIQICLKQGMEPRSTKHGFTSMAVLNKFEEEATDLDWSRAFDELRE